MELNEILSGLNACKDDLSPISGTRGLFGGSLALIIVLFILFCGCGHGFGGGFPGGYPGAYPPVAPGPTSAVSPFATEAHKTKKKIPVCKVSNYYPIQDQCCEYAAPFAGVSPYSAAPAPAPYGGGFGGCGFGGGSWWWIWIIIIFIIFGFGRRNSIGSDIV
ncbi:hypothetical protein CPJCM30710_33770 [Clostridium polyendosporum]|uniref:Uncharacterized protein n=1 Tax=Clostridium polyendosporum TaxID=69208 RepID=A0A919S2I7_9CLOT|nr:hypothetical protein [Clostridium polyendosporum]GIM30711.1 hypothetical protein CPJCM30710_33770 [Clostridium polyendosporum]